ncbi:type VII secretion protein EccB [Nocardioides sp. ChNu-153]|uniref:type VII secretion protein EccB n=1 Tax=unclassified Nocardioides TaxID=2615069 RepID=UPI002406BB0C|nr:MULTISPECIES: type VII secretion protein EccB [unclassified Nocardioides]MDF9718060.1 type VII secretion protein EccB [Nocardioides sp. ChNu-99]MDN7122390.1 type VII secretion protein EccB [Nocardioides sp. ChNu-153]
MATKRDLVEAYGFSRRRLVTAFISGAPGGREVEPSRPGRAIVGGIALTVLVLAAAAVVGFLKPRADAGWADTEGLVIVEESGEQFLVQVDEEGGDTVLVPVVNTTSARLVLGPDLAPTTVPQEEVDRYALTETVGILNAPPSLPSPNRLVGSGWTACTGREQGVRIAVQESPDVTVDGSAQVVRVGEEHHLLALGQTDEEGNARAFRMQMPSDPAVLNEMLGLLRGPALEEVPEVSRGWLDLFPAADPLADASFAVEGQTGQPLAGVTLANGAPATVGTLATYNDGPVVLQAGGYQPLDAFAAAVYQSLRGAAPVEVSGDVGTRGSAAGDPGRWPTDLPEFATGDRTDSFCAVLRTHDDVPPTVELAVRPGDAAAADGVPVGTVAPAVQQGRGAVVDSGGFGRGEAGDAFLVDAQGIRYALQGNALTQLGYDGGSTPVVPASWVEGFECGVALAREEALKTLSPDRQVAQSCPGQRDADGAEAAPGGSGGTGGTG